MIRTVVVPVLYNHIFTVSIFLNLIWITLTNITKIVVLVIKGI